MRLLQSKLRLINIPESDLSEYSKTIAIEALVTQQINAIPDIDLSTYASKTELSETYATTEQINNLISEAVSDAEIIGLSGVEQEAIELLLIGPTVLSPEVTARFSWIRRSQDLIFV